MAMLPVLCHFELFDSRHYHPVLYLSWSSITAMVECTDLAPLYLGFLTRVVEGMSTESVIDHESKVYAFCSKGMWGFCFLNNKYFSLELIIKFFRSWLIVIIFRSIVNWPHWFPPIQVSIVKWWRISSLMYYFRNSHTSGAMLSPRLITSCW